MPIRAPRICGCGKVVAYGVMCACQLKRQAERKARHDATRPTANQRGYDGKWRKERAAYLLQHPTCQHCHERPATVVHHKIPHKGDRKLFWRRSNWMPACQPCHDGPLQSQERRTDEVQP